MRALQDRFCLRSSFVYPDYQWFPLIYAFVVVVVGGLGSVIGSIVGG